MKWITLKSLAIPTLIAGLCLGISVLLYGCDLQRSCPFVAGSDPSCSLSLPEPGIYQVTYRDTTGAEQTKEIAVVGMSGDAFVCIGGCTEIIGEPLLISPLPPTNTRPDCSQARASIPILPNDPPRMVEESIEGVTDPDGDPVGIAVANFIEEDEPMGALFEGDLCPDTLITSASTGRVRAERSENGSGRVYTIGFTASDRNGGFCTGKVEVCVPLSEGDTCFNDGGVTPFCPSHLLSSDLSVTLVDSADPISPGDVLTYTIVVTNSGPDSSSNVLLTDTLPQGVAYLGAETDSQTDCSYSAGMVNCHVSPTGSFFMGETNTIKIKVLPQVNGTYTNTVNVTALEADPNLDNNTATTTTVVTDATVADLTVSITESPDPVIRGEAVTYVVTTTNNGSATATNVVLTNVLPPLEVSNSDIEVSQGSFSRPPRTNRIICNFGTLAPGASATLAFTGFTSTLGTITNTASAAANETDPNTANNSDSEDTTVTASLAMGLFAPWLDEAQLNSACRNAQFERPVEIWRTDWFIRLMWSMRHCSQPNEHRG